MARLPARLRDRGGFALALAIFALVLLAAVVAGGYFSASQESQIGRGMRSLTTSFYAGEAGIFRLLEDWDPSLYGGLQPGETLSVGPYTFEGGGTASASVVRVGKAADSLKRYFYIEIAGRPPGAGQGERRQAVVVRALYPELCCEAAVTAIDSVTFGGGGQPIISGFDAGPPSWPASACAPFGSDSTPGLTISASGSVNDSDRVEGTPVPIVTSGTLTPANIFDLGDLTYDDLVSLADHTFTADTTTIGDSQPSILDGECNTSDPLNWGAPADPNHPCFDYFPIMHVTGVLEVVGSGSAQGIVLVDGDFKLTGPFDFYGIALVKDDLRLGGPIDFYGGAYVADNVTVSGATPRFRFSHCAVERAERLSRLSRPYPVSPRAWVELF